MSDNATLLLAKQLKGVPPPSGLPTACRRLFFSRRAPAKQRQRAQRPVGSAACAELNKNPVEGFSAGLKDDGNVFVWEVMIMGPPETMYEGGFFNALLTFPPEYPNHPPKLKFVSDFYHPNVYPDGTVCISILHAPGEDRYGYEDASERWLPIHTVESILVSVLSMISSPNLESPANIDAAKLFRDDPAAYRKQVQRCVRRSQEG